MTQGGLQFQLDSLGWYTFERLVHALLKVIVGPGVSSFGGSKDAGRDACLYNSSAPFPTETAPWSGNWVFQVKFNELGSRGYAGARSQLISTIDGEIQKILARATSPIGRRMSTVDNYVIFTNVPITPLLEAKLFDKVRCAGFQGNFRVVNGKDICDYLLVYDQIRRSFPQLLGLSDIDLIINKAVRQRSQAYLERYQRDLRKFVRTEAYEQAWNVLRERHFVVLDGPPEVGKSFVCAALAVLYASNGYEIIEIRTPDDFWQNFTYEFSQLFVADDAIGTVALEHSRTVAWERDLKAVLGKLDATHLMIWTARRYILETSLEVSKLGTVGGGFPTINEVIVQADNLTEKEKAEILYNHAKFADLDSHCKKMIQNYATQIVKHANYHPERIRALVEDKLKGLLDRLSWKPELVNWRTIDTFLKDPGESWSIAFDALSAEDQDLLIALLDFTHGALVENLEIAFNLRLEVSNATSFAQCMERLQQSFVRRVTTYMGTEVVDFQHPSIRDILIARLRANRKARLLYIQHVSVAGIPAILDGIRGAAEGGPIGGTAAAKVEAENRRHVLTLGDREEVDALCERIGRLAEHRPTIRDWSAILASCERLVPHRGKRKPLSPAEVNVEEFEAAPEGRILSATLSTFNKDIERIDPDMINATIDVVDTYYRLIRYTTSAARFSGLKHLWINRGKSTLNQQLRLIDLVRRYEPIIWEQLGTEQCLVEINYNIKEHLENLIRNGREAIDNEWYAYDWSKDNYKWWHEDAEHLKNDLTRWRNLLRDDVNEYLDTLSEMLHDSPEPDDEDEEEEYEFEERDDQDYWTIERMYEDL